MAVVAADEAALFCLHRLPLAAVGNCHGPWQQHIACQYKSLICGDLCARKRVHPAYVQPPKRRNIKVQRPIPSIWRELQCIPGRTESLRELAIVERPEVDSPYGLSFPGKRKG